MITVRRETAGSTAHVVEIRAHELLVDMAIGDGGRDAGPDPHDLYDSALGACKALTVLWYAQRHAIPVEDIRVRVLRDNSAERTGAYRLSAELTLGGNLSAQQRSELLSVAEKCPVHRLMTTVRTEIATVSADAVD